MQAAAVLWPLTYAIAEVERPDAYSRHTRGLHMKKRRRFKQTTSLKDRLASFAKTTRERASLLRPGAEKDALLEKARQADAAAHLDDWASSPGLRSPKSGSEL